MSTLSYHNRRFSTPSASERARVQGEGPLLDPHEAARLLMQYRVELAQQKEELNIWTTASERLFWECSQTHEELTKAIARTAELEDHCDTMLRQQVQLAANLECLRRNFVFTFFSLKFVGKQFIKLVLARLRLRVAPDPSAWLPTKPPI